MFRPGIISLFFMHMSLQWSIQSSKPQVLSSVQLPKEKKVVSGWTIWAVRPFTICGQVTHVLWRYQPFKYGGFHKWGYPKWMVYSGKSHLNGWFGGTPFMETPIWWMGWWSRGNPRFFGELVPVTPISLRFMVDILTYFLWFIKQLMTRGHHLAGMGEEWESSWDWMRWDDG